MSWAEVADRGLGVAGGLAARGLAPASPVILAIDEPLPLLTGIWGCLLGGFTPVPASAAQPGARLDTLLPGAVRLDAAELEMLARGTRAPMVDAAADDVALLLATSGSTGEAKLVALTHGNVLAGIAGFVAATAFGPGERSLNWLPLRHVGGLTRSLRDVVVGCPQIQVETSLVAADPLAWIELMGRHAATTSWAPNFAFGRASAAALEQPRRCPDLGAVRSLWSSGEPVVLRTLERLAAALAPHGLRRETLSATWGMTEVCSATVARDLLARPPAGPFASAGAPVPGIALRVVDGRLEVRGAACAARYASGAATAGADGWLRTGDLARVEGGELVITGRAAHVLRQRGTSRGLGLIEETVEASGAVEPGYTAALVLRDAASDTEELAVAFHAEGGPLSSTLRRVRQALAGQLGLSARHLLPLAREDIRPGGAGKIDRARLLARLGAGELDAALEAVAAASRGDGGDLEPTQARVARAVAEVLGVERPARGDSIFELGADSLAVTQLAARLARDFPHRAARAVDLYRLTTVEALAGWLEGELPRAAPAAATPRARDGAIAIIGAALRFPGASSVEELWHNLREGVESIRFLTPEELSSSGVHPRWLSHPDYVPAAGVVDGVEDFDAERFAMSPAEADILDPQQRLLLECACEVLERAGHATPARRARTGVFAGVRISEYQAFNLPPPDIAGLGEGSPVAGLARVFANDKDYVAPRLSFKLDLRGPSISVQTACSTSLVAVHLACRSLLEGECDLALAGGATVRVPQLAGYLHSEGMTFSRDGHTRAFDAAASGTLFSSGAGLVLLKRLDRALADGDDVWAVIRGSAVNNDGAEAKAGFPAPSQTGQTRVIRDALVAAGVPADSVSYVEAHGTGTGLGDPIELAALNDAYRGARRGACGLGSLKTNVGHMVQAAGIGGLIKVALMLRHRELVPHLHFQQPNPLIRFDEGPFRVVTERRAWSAAPGEPRRAGVSSFGVGGTNAHVILEEAPARRPAPAALDRPAHLITLSAPTEGALRGLAARFADAVDDDAALGDVCLSANTGRQHLAHRLAVVAATPAGLREALRAAAIHRAPAASPRVAMLFPGQGAQHAGMARGLHAASPIFREVLDRADRVLEPILGASLTAVLLGDAPGLDDTRFAQPALLAVELGLLAMWRSWGVTPAAVLGHSVGEYAAACAAGVLAEEDALRLVGERARLMAELPREGAMAAVAAPEAEIAAALGAHVEIAAWNAPDHVVLSGERAALEAALASLPGAAVDRLRVSHAFHSRLMEPVLARFGALAGEVRFVAPGIDFYSSVTGALAAAELTDAGYWTDQIRRPVRFADAARSLAAAGHPLWLEVGPGATLLGLARLGGLDAHRSVPSLRRGREDWPALLGAARDLYLAGVTLDWEAMEAPYARRRVWLPATPFERQRHWIEPGRAPRQTGEEHPLLGRRLSSPLAARQYEAHLAPDRPALIGDHVVHGAVVVPATAYIEMLAAAGVDALGPPPLEIVDLVIVEALVLPREGRAVHTVLEPRPGGGYAATISSRDPRGAWTLHVTASVIAGGEPLQVTPPPARLPRRLPLETYYAEAARRGLTPGPAYHNLESIELGDGQALGAARLAGERAAETSAYVVHPALLDSCLMPAVAVDESSTSVPFLPTVWERVHIARALPAAVSAHARLLERDDETRTVALAVHTEDGAPCVVVERLCFKRAPRAAVVERAQVAWLHEVGWQPRAAPPAPAPAGGDFLVVGGGATSAALAAALEAQGALVHGRPPPGVPLRGAIYLGGLAIPPTEVLGARGTGAGERACAEVLGLVQELVERGDPVRLTLVTRGAHAVLSPDRVTVAAAPLIGFARVAHREHPRLGCTLVDLDLAAAPGDVQGLLAEILGGGEDEVAWRAGQRFVPRLRRRTPGLTGGSPRARDATPRDPGAGEVRVRVEASGLNFKDVLSALGRFDQPLGLECAGTVEACGAGVDDLRPGDAVIVLARGSLASHVVVPRGQVARAPRGMRLEAAAALPVAFLTAGHALVDIAALRAGQRVLIHAAAGGVGLAAVQLARHAGAEVFALAHPAKWPVLEGLGVAHLMSSRAPGFAREILRLTAGAGVDVVLSSLADELMDESVAALAPGGWFIDLGVSGRWDAERLAAARPGARYAHFQLLERVARQPDALRAPLEELVRDIESGRLAPLPVTRFPIEEKDAALRHMAQARHVGKIVLGHDPRPPARVRDDRAYLVTGGLGALGLEVAGWLAERGARHLVLVGRSPRPEASARLAALAARGVSVRLAQVDLSRRAEVAALLADQDPPLAGVFHAAGVLDDGALATQTPERLARVFAGKVHGAWHLSELTSGMDLDWFVLFSSQSGLLGTPGQASYAAASTFLDALAHHRRAAGLVALSIDWGAWSAGMASGLDAKRRAALGLGVISPAEGLRALERVLSEDTAQVGVMPVDWTRFARGLGDRVPSLVADLTPLSAAAAAPREARRQPRDPAALQALARDEAARILSLPAATLDVTRPLGELGLDSLMAVELRNRLAEVTGVGLPMAAILRRPSARAIGDQLCAAVGSAPPVPEPATPPLAVAFPAAAGPRFFCVHGIDGGFAHLASLAEALRERLRFVALRARGLASGESPAVSTDEMVRAYLETMRALQPHGPYLLGGYCVGGVVAVEMARRLVEQGERVALLALIDSVYPWKTLAESGLGKAELARRIAVTGARWASARLRQRELPDLRRYAVHLWRRLRGRPYDIVEAPPLEGASADQERVWDATLRALAEHTPRPYHGPVLALRARDDRRFMRALDPHLGWRLIARGGLEIVDVPGDHATLLEPPNVDALAALLGERVAQASSG